MKNSRGTRSVKSRQGCQWSLIRITTLNGAHRDHGKA
jgi:hypothetical protein